MSRGAPALLVNISVIDPMARWLAHVLLSKGSGVGMYMAGLGVFAGGVPRKEHGDFHGRLGVVSKGVRAAKGDSPPKGRDAATEERPFLCLGDPSPTVCSGVASESDRVVAAVDGVTTSFGDTRAGVSRSDKVDMCFQKKQR
mmetsp:Transcript_21569/g.52550  ORF Transcript_21569/g.52550 Transcript_21569/m.52550 type:complete len:142 (-) Transcript_21569:120-545(-)